MAQSLIRGNTQILAGSITADRFAASLNLPTNQLQDGASFIKKEGTVAFNADQSMGGYKLTNVADPVASQDAANLRTVQALVNGIVIKPSCRAVAIANIALTGLQTIDGVTLVANDRVLLTGQTTPSQNGLWIAASGAWSRATDYTAASIQKAGLMVIITEGTTYADTKWLCITDGNITVDTTSTVWNQDLSGIVYTAGTGINLTGNAFSVKYGNGIQADGSQNVSIKLDGSSLALSASGIKIANGTAGRILMANASGVATYTAVSGDVTISNTGVTSINTTPASGFIKYTSYVENETPGGTINGSNTAFTLANTPNGIMTDLFLNGQLLEAGAGNDYTISGSTITMLYAPIAGDKLRAFYLK